MRTIYTDGARRTSTGSGGWAYVVLEVEDDGTARETARRAGSAVTSTNNRMELTAVCVALEDHPEEQLHICVDSTYVFNGVTTLVWHWRENGWLTKSSRKSVANQDLWKRLLTALHMREVEPTWERIPGHDGNVWNELCDKLAVAESRSVSL